MKNYNKEYLINLLIVFLLIAIIKIGYRKNYLNNIHDVDINEIRNYLLLKNKYIEEKGFFVDKIPLKINDSIYYFDLIVNNLTLPLSIELDSIERKVFCRKKINYDNILYIGSNSKEVMLNDKIINNKNFLESIKKSKLKKINEYFLYIIVSWKDLSNDNKVFIKKIIKIINRKKLKIILDYKNKRFFSLVKIK